MSLVNIEIHSFARHQKCDLSQRFGQWPVILKSYWVLWISFFIIALEGIVILGCASQSTEGGEARRSSLTSLSFSSSASLSLDQPFMQQDKKKKTCLLSVFPHVDVHWNPFFSFVIVFLCSSPQMVLASRFGHMTRQRDLRSLRRRCWYSLSSCR